MLELALRLKGSVSALCSPANSKSVRPFRSADHAVFRGSTTCLLECKPSCSVNVNMMFMDDWLYIK